MDLNLTSQVGHKIYIDRRSNKINFLIDFHPSKLCRLQNLQKQILTCFTSTGETNRDTFPGLIDMGGYCVHMKGWLLVKQWLVPRSVVLLCCKTDKHPCSIDLKGHFKCMLVWKPISATKIHQPLVFLYLIIIT